MKTLGLILTLSLYFTQYSLSQGISFFAPVREGISSYSLNNSKVINIIHNLGQETTLKKLNAVLNQVYNLELDSASILDVTRTEFSNLFKNNCSPNSYCERNTLNALFLIARKNELIDDVFLYHIKNELNLNDHHLNISIVDYFYKLESTRNAREKSKDNTTVLNNLLNNDKRYLRKIKPLGKLTPRQRIFLIYSQDEIKLINDVLNSFLIQLYSSKSYLVFENENGITDKVNLSSYEQSKISKLLLDRSLRRLYDEKKITHYPLYSDILAIGLETGIINNELLNEFLKSPGLTDKYTPAWKKFLNITSKIGKSVLLLNPATNFYALIAIMLIDSFKQMKDANDKVTIDHLF